MEPHRHDHYRLPFDRERPLARWDGGEACVMADSSDEEVDGGPDPQLLLDELSADTLSALQQHLDSKTAESESSDDEAFDGSKGGAGISEDFGMSQFWVRARHGPPTRATIPPSD